MHPEYQIEVSSGRSSRNYTNYFDSLKKALNDAEHIAHTYGFAEVNIVRLAVSGDAPDGEIVQRTFIASFSE